MLQFVHKIVESKSQLLRTNDCVSRQNTAKFQISKSFGIIRYVPSSEINSL